MNVCRRTVLMHLAGAVALGVPASALASRTRTPIPIPPDLLLAMHHTDDVDPADCLVSEKFDGVRAFWDGRTLRHRSGHAIAAPAWFTARLPAQALDGELWAGRRRFESLVGTVRRQHGDDDAWQQVRYMVFELPDAPGPFVERVARIERLVRGAHGAPLVAVAQERVGDRAALRRKLDAVVRAGGEGLMLHRADAPYLTGRREVLTKLKPQFDAEARVVGSRAGRGRFAGQLGALELETPEGVRFHLGSGLPDALRRQPPPPGALVTYRYHDLTAAGVPRFASFLRLHAVL